MSYCAMYAALEDGEMQQAFVYHNSWGGAARVWDALSREHLGGRHAWMDQSAKSSELWALAHDESLPWFARNAHLITFDRMLIRPEDAELAALSLEAFNREYPTSDERAVNHLPDWARDMRQTATKARAIGFYATSVAECLWQLQEDCPTCEQPTDDYRAYNIDRDDQHRWAELVSAP